MVNLPFDQPTHLGLLPTYQLIYKFKEGSRDKVGMHIMFYVTLGMYTMMKQNLNKRTRKLA